MRWTLLLLPQRYKFSSKSQRRLVDIAQEWGCCCYRKGTNFQANHNGTGYLILPLLLLLLPQRYKSSSKSQQTTLSLCPFDCCCCYRKGTNFQANHNCRTSAIVWERVVVATAKVQIFKQITTAKKRFLHSCSCCCYRKGTNFQANHNTPDTRPRRPRVVVATAKVQIFKQITTHVRAMLLICRCCCYRKGTNFQANHNWVKSLILLVLVVVATAKVQIFKQITT